MSVGIIAAYLPDGIRWIRDEIRRAYAGEPLPSTWLPDNDPRRGL